MNRVTLDLLAHPSQTRQVEKEVSIPTESSSKKKAVSILRSMMILVDFFRGTKWPNMLFNLDNTMPAVLRMGEGEIGQTADGVIYQMQKKRGM